MNLENYYRFNSLKNVVLYLSSSTFKFLYPLKSLLLLQMLAILLLINFNNILLINQLNLIGNIFYCYIYLLLIFSRQCQVLNTTLFTIVIILVFATAHYVQPKEVEVIMKFCSRCKIFFRIYQFISFSRYGFLTFSIIV